MNEKLKATALRVKNHVVRQKYAYGFATLAALAMWTQQRNMKVFNEFLIEKGIDPLEFYNPEWYAEKNS